MVGCGLVKLGEAWSGPVGYGSPILSHTIYHLVGSGEVRLGEVKFGLVG